MMNPSHDEVIRVFAPGTVSNLGPGFDVLGMAVSGRGDTITARLVPGNEVRISHIEGCDAILPLDPTKNTAGIAAIETLQKAGVEVGVEMEIRKGIPIGSGLGGSAASAAAGAFATNLLVGSPLRKADLVAPCVQAEAAVSGRHADNVAPALLGGLVLVRSADPADLLRIPVPDGLMVVVVTPRFALSTRRAREVLPPSVPLAAMVRNSANIATFIAACYSGDLSLFSRSLIDDEVVSARSALIPGCREVITAALNAGALGASISGAGPSIFAFCHSPRSAQTAATAMANTFLDAGGLESTKLISPADCPGVRRL